MSRYVLGERAAEAVRNLMRGASSVGSYDSSEVGIIDPKEYPHPWEIEWSQSEGEGSGAWIIYLPAIGSFKDAAEKIDTKFQHFLATLTNATGRTDWKILSSLRNVNGSATVYFRINPANDNAVDISPSQVAGCICIPIADIHRDTSSGNRPPVTVKQRLVGELVYGGGSSSVSRAFDIATATESGQQVLKVVNCKIAIGNQFVTCDDATLNRQGGDVYLHVTRGSTGYTITVDQTEAAETATTISVKLWEFSGGAPTLDVRPGHIPCFAL